MPENKANWFRFNQLVLSVCRNAIKTKRFEEIWSKFGAYPKEEEIKSKQKCHHVCI